MDTAVPGLRETGWRVRKVNIVPGQTIRAFSAQTGVDIDEVVCWIRAYVNEPTRDFPGMTVEPTERERFASIAGYINMRISIEK